MSRIDVDRLKKWSLLGVGVLLFGLYLNRLDWSAIRAAAVHPTISISLGVVFLGLGNGLLKLRRWRQLLVSRGVDRPRSLWMEYMAVNAGFFLGLVTPGTAGELARGALSEVSESRALAIVAFEKTTDLGVLLLMVLASFVTQFTFGWRSWAFAGGLALLCLAAYSIYVRFDRMLTTPARWLLELLASADRVETARQVYWEYFEMIVDRRTLLRSSAYSFALWLLPVLQMYLILRGLGVDVMLKTAALTFLLPYLIGVVSMIPSGIGSFDFAVHAVGERALLSGGAGVAAAALAPLYFRLLVTLPLILLGLASHVYLAIRERET